MKISSQHAGQAQAAQHAERARQAQPQPIERGAAQRGGDRVDLSRDPGQSPAQRVDVLADKIHERLALLAESTGLDLSEVERAFDQHVERIQAGLADGSLDEAALAQGVSNVLDLLRADLRSAIGDRDSGLAREGGAPRVDPHSPEARVEALAASVEERIAALAEELGGSAARGLGLALEAFGEHVDRLLAGIADGSLSGEALSNGVQSVLDLVRQDVQRGLDRAGDPPGRDSDPGALETRFESFVDHLGARLDALAESIGPEQSAAFADLQASFGSAMDRLGNAFFDQGSIDRQQFQELFSSLFEELRAEVKGLFGQDPPAAGAATLYHPVTGVEQLGGGMPGGLDTTV